MTALQAARERLEEYIRLCYLRQDRLETEKLRRLEDALVETASIEAVRRYVEGDPF